MSNSVTTCPGCGLEKPAGTSVYEGYYHASPECWSLFLEVMTREYEDPRLFAEVHQLSVDAYAVQHAGGAHPDKSVGVHLVGLHLVLERGLDPLDVPRRLHVLSERVTRWPQFERPTSGVRLDITHVYAADESNDHIERARSWSREVWSSWSTQHARVAELARFCLEDSTSSRELGALGKR